MSRQHSVASIAVTIFTLWCGAAMASDLGHEDVPLTAHWEYYAKVKHIPTPESAPSHDGAMGPSSYDTFNSDPSKAIYLEWFKADFQDAQTLRDKTYKTEIMLVKIDCQRRVYRVMRDLKYAQDGRVIDDLKSPSATRPFKVMVDDNTLPLAEEFASTGYDFLCVSNGD